MLPLQPHPVQTLALCLLLRHQASLLEQQSLKQESLWAWLLLQCHLQLAAALQSTPGSTLRRACYTWNGGFDIQLKRAMEGKKNLKIRECGITISKENRINSCSVMVRLAGHIHAMDTPGFGCPANANQCPALPKHSLYLLIQHEGKSFISPCGSLPQGAQDTFSCVQPSFPTDHIWDRVLCLHLPCICFPFLHYDFCIVIINGWLTSTLHFFISVCNIVLRIMDL